MAPLWVHGEGGLGGSMATSLNHGGGGRWVGGLICAEGWCLGAGIRVVGCKNRVVWLQAFWAGIEAVWYHG
ncbi:hypothetical protein GOBAR_DD01707 [Gossypium barbadense]|nr:hypothetical protein GOBAR_DD01707 [Gossypium barbadense]